MKSKEEVPAAPLGATLAATSPVSLSGSLGASVGSLKLGGPGVMLVVGFDDVGLLGTMESAGDGPGIFSSSGPVLGAALVCTRVS